MTTILRAAFLMALGATTCRGQALAPTLAPTAPEPRALQGMSYDAARQRTLVFGGFLVGGAPDNTLWAWDGERWSVAARGGPSPRGNVLMAYDAARDRVVLHGGEIPGLAYRDTWEWDGSTWTRAATEGPPVRAHGAMAYDARRRRLVLFGGTLGGPSRNPDDQRPGNDTWEWDGVRWGQSAAPGPPGRSVHAMAFDDRRGVVLMTGGSVRGGPTFDDLWEWDGGAWRPIGASGPRRHSHSMVSLGDRGVLVFGGGIGPDLSPNDTWLWDGRTWTRVAVDGPSARYAPGLAWDAARQRVVLFGGISPAGELGETWELDVTAWRWSRR
jgi:hypothetical protein